MPAFIDALREFNSVGSQEHFVVGVMVGQAGGEEWGSLTGGEIGKRNPVQPQKPPETDKVPYRMFHEITLLVDYLRDMSHALRRGVQTAEFEKSAASSGAGCITSHALKSEMCSRP
jgi:hypothetical protein